MSDTAGRSCPIRYRYGAEAIAGAPLDVADTLYVVGGLYGNLPALDCVEAMAACEDGPVTICFNGDFNWFNVDDSGFDAINSRVLTHQAIVGNVEAELCVDGEDAGCGCAYPDQVDAAAVVRSNRIHTRLKSTAARRPNVLAQLAALPMFARYAVGDCRVGVIHGDADSLAGWRFDVDALHDHGSEHWLASAFQRADVDVFASTHTCQPALRPLGRRGEPGVVINNGAAGMPNFRTRQEGIITRVGVRASPHGPLYGTVAAGAHVDALAVAYDKQSWTRMFLANWPAGSDAYTSYFSRISGTVDFDIEHACGMR